MIGLSECKSDHVKATFIPQKPARKPPVQTTLHHLDSPLPLEQVVKRINNAFERADQMQHAEGRKDIYWFAPIVADAEAGFGGNLNAYELMKALIEAGAAGVHFEGGQTRF